MTDVVDKATRSRMMSGIRGKDTKPEMIVRRYLHRHGFRYRLHDRNLPGHPDIIFPRYHAVIFVHGCFWHGHNCRYFKLPATRTEFWRDKIRANILRDISAKNALRQKGWRVLIVWECALRGPEASRSLSLIRRWTASNRSCIEIGGGPHEKTGRTR